MLAPVQQLRPSSPPPPRTPEREALRIAIEVRATAARRLDRVHAAQEAASGQVLGAKNAVRQTETALAEVKADQTRHLARVALGEAQGSPVEDAAVALEEAQEALAAARATQDALAAEAASVEKELAAAEFRLDAAVKAVAKAGMAQLVADYETSRNTYLDMCRTMTALSRLGCSPLSRWGGSIDDGSRPDPIVAQGWVTAITARRSDADAELPQS